MSKRHENALFINEGACNPSGIAHAIVQACQEVRAEPTHTGTDALRNDPALRLMVNQLSFLMHNGEMPAEDWTTCVAECTRIVKETAGRLPS